MENKCIVLCGCTKNSSGYIYRNLENLYNIKSLCKEFHVVLFENDSSDTTKDVLKEFRDSHLNVHLIFDTLNGKISTPETTKPYSRYVQKPLNLTYSRNSLLSYVRTHFLDFDYMIMVDLDSVIRDFKTSIINEVIEKYQYDSWDALTANSDKKYYDIWALRIHHDVWNPDLHGILWKDPIDYDCWMMRDKNKSVNANQICIPHNSPLIPVNSAFGGLGIYKISSIENCMYDAEYDGSLTCEHVYFHNEMIKKGCKIFICPSLIVKSQCRN